MKRLFFATIALLVSTTLSVAQDNLYLSTGRSFVGGGISLSVDSNEPNNNDPTVEEIDRSFSGSVSPTYGKFFRDRWVAGVSLTISHQNDRNEEIGENTSRENTTRALGIGITPFLRRYLPITERFGAYIQPEVSFTYRRTVTEQEQRDANQPAANNFFSITGRRHSGSLGAQAGLYYFITEHFSVETNLLRAYFAINRRSDEITTVDNIVEQTTESTRLSAQFSLINQLSLDRILVLNYYF